MDNLFDVERRDIAVDREGRAGWWRQAVRSGRCALCSVRVELGTRHGPAVGELSPEGRLQTRQWLY